MKIPQLTNKDNDGNLYAKKNCILSVMIYKKYGQLEMSKSKLHSLDRLELYCIIVESA